eukprot:gene5267-3763_t
MERLRFKREAMAKYKFYLAFENTNERGYVTEKVFDALYAGVVPVYLGSKVDCQALMPSAHSVIYVDDFDHDMSRLGEYLTHFDNEFTKDEDDYVPAAVKRDSASWSSSDEESSFSSTDSSEKSVSFVDLAERNNAVDAESS